MRDDLEARLRAVAELLPEPDDRATTRAREAMCTALSSGWGTGSRPIAWLRSRRRGAYLLAAALAVAAGGSAIAAIGLGPRPETAPDTPAGAAVARDLLGALGDHTPRLPGERGANFLPVPTTARVVFSARTRWGEYTIWRARTSGRRGRATIFSSPRTGLTSSHGVEPRAPRRPYVEMVGGGASPPLSAREIYGRASPGVVAVEVVLRDGSRRPAIARNGWFVFSQDYGHPPPVRLVGLDDRGEPIATSRRPAF